MLLEKIRVATADRHLELESILSPFINNLKTPEEYLIILKSFYGYVFPVQEMIIKYIDAATLPDINNRRNSDLLLRDIENLGDYSEIKKAVLLPQICNTPSAIGALYVLEGSTLGGKIISRMITEKTGLNKSLDFFTGYGSETGKMWKKFTDYLSLIKEEAAQNQIVNGAEDTFKFFIIWLSERLHLPSAS